MAPSRLRGILALAALAVVLACVEVRLESLVCGVPIETQAEQVVNIARGTPDWRAWQNRLLVSWPLMRLSELSGRKPAAIYAVALMVLRLAKNLLFGLALYRLRGDAALCARYLLLFSLLSLASLDELHLYPWDHVDIMVFTLFLVGVFRGARAGFFAVLFLPALLNRESALFLPVWLLLDSVRLDLRARGRTALAPLGIDARKFLAGAALLVGGVAAVRLLRGSLLVRELGPSLRPEFAADGAVHLGWNMDFLLTSWHDFSPAMDGLRTLCIVAVPLWFLFVRKELDGIELKLAALVAGMWLSILLFGLVWETRSWSMLLPFAVLVPFYHLHLRGGALASASGAPSEGSAH